jgi:broad specificity phosphatase PhoE
MTDAVRESRLTGRSPGVDLNEVGRKQAAKTADLLSKLSVKAVYSSPLERTRQTAGALSRALGLETRVDERLNELDMGEWTARRVDELRERADWKRYHLLRSCTAVPGGESVLDVQARAMSAINDLRGRHEGEVVAVVTHADVIKLVVTYLAGIHIDLMQRIDIAPGSVTPVTLGSDFVKIHSINSTGGVEID